MRILVNASNLKLGGAVQKGVQTFLGCRDWGGDHTWRFILSPEIAECLNLINIPAHMTASICPFRPASIFEGFAARRLLATEEVNFGPNVVYSVFGPTYCRFTRPHLMGFAIGWITHPSELAWRSFSSFNAKFQFRLRLAYYAWWARHADQWLLETDVAAAGLEKAFGLEPGLTHVIPNSCSDYFSGFGGSSVTCLSDHVARGAIRLLVLTSYKAHKNLEIIPRVAAELERVDPARQYLFVFSLPKDSGSWRRLAGKASNLGVGERLATVGYVPPHLSPEAYHSSHGLFLPTLLETFSANYPEAMASGRPIMTSDLDFAREVCGDAACYFDPLDPGSAARAITRVYQNQDYRASLVAKGRSRLDSFGTSEGRFRKLLEVLMGMVEDGQ